ncbi:putative Late nodulin [Medicago truncatula]|uniref:Nodule Cysteine-Rich (NCR) secreted peptide n=1 Tax=Medicago truncatula TaxID=3880 RepID=A0A072VTT4_MEDTR|nr:Nodule Cysteine-Rich (NCR) secreted peptide [Medicago truncatula]RHN79142.1 putative Late nodulin [Medicago truncatula]
MTQISKSFYALIIFLSLILVVTSKDITCTVAGDCPNFFVCPPNNFVRCIRNLCKCRSLSYKQP